MQNEVQMICIIAALVMLSKNAVPQIRNHRPILIHLKESLTTLIKDDGTRLEHIWSHIIQTVNKSLSTELKPFELTQEQNEMMKNIVEKTLSAKDPVFSLLKRRIHAVVKSTVERGQIRLESLASHGLDLVEKELDSLSRRAYLLAKHNKEVHATHYNTILSSII